MNENDVREAFVSAGLTRLLKDLGALTKPSMRIVSTPANEIALKIGASKLGGAPDLPQDIQWPTWKTVPQSFVGQLRLKDISSYDIEHVLPPQGMLWFFYSSQQQTDGANPDDLGSWSVLFRADEANLSRRPPPATLPAQSRFKACRLNLTNDITLPLLPALEIANFDWSEDEQKRYDDLYAAFPHNASEPNYQHRILGHPYTLQDDMHQQCQLISHGVRDINDPRIDALSKGVLNWRLLLQIDTDERIGMRWGSSGILYFWIRKPDLQARYFDETWLVVQSE